LGMLSQCRKHQGLKCVPGKAEEIPFEDSYFDKVLIVDAFHHFKDREKSLVEISRVLKRGGKLIIQEVNFGRIGNRILETAEFLAGAKSRIVSPKELAGLLAENGFEVKIFFEDTSGPYFLCIKR
jgi:SAM-dependent methyltransferase